MTNAETADTRIAERLAPLAFSQILRLRRKLTGGNPLFPTRQDFWKEEEGGHHYDTVAQAIGYEPDVYSMTAGCIRTILELLEITGSTRVLELGAGISTVTIAHYLAATGRDSCEIFTLEEDATHLARVGEWLAGLGLAEIAVLNTVPLTDCRVGEQQTASYRVAEVEQALNAREPFEVMVIDGPKSGGPGGRPFARLPTLPQLAKWLAPGALVVLDDGFRDMELKTVQTWVEQDWVVPLGYSVEGKGLFIGRLA